MAKGADEGGGKKGSILGLVGSVLLLTLVAAGGGYGVGTKIIATVNAEGTPQASKKVETAKPAPTMLVKELPPIVTNLAAPDGVWVRLETAIVYDKTDKTDAQHMDLLTAHIVEDFMAYVKTLTVAQLQGAIGLEHLREDLNDRVGLRSEGHVKEVMIEALVIE